MITNRTLRELDLATLRIETIENKNSIEYKVGIVSLDEEKLIKHIKSLSQVPESLDWIFNYIKFVPMRKIAKAFESRFGLFPILTHNVELCFIDYDKGKDRTVYRIHPLYPELAVGENGTVRNVNTGKILKQNIEAASIFYNISYYSVSLRNKILLVHRLVAEAWVPNDDYVKKYVVDHIDRDKHNNSSKNLRWVSSRVNIARHSVNNTDNSDNRYLVLDIKNNQIHAFPSLYKLGDFLGEDRRNLHVKTFPFIIKVKTKDGDRVYIVEDANNFTNWSLLNSANLHGYRYKLIYPNKVVRYYKRIEDILEVLGIPEAKLRGNYYEALKRLLEPQGYELIKIAEKEVYNQYSNNKYKIEAKDLDTGEIIVADSTKLMAEKLGLGGKNKSQIIFRLNGNKREGLPLEVNGKRYLIRKSTEPWPEIKNKTNKSRKIKDLTTGRIFNSLRELAREYGINRSRVKIKLDTGTCERFVYAE